MSTRGPVVPSENGAGRPVIRGRVVTSALTSVPGAAVTAFRVGLGRKEPIGESLTDSAGGYAIEWGREAHAEDLRPDLRVRASLEGVEVGAAVLYNAPPEASIDVVVAPGSVLRGDEHTRIVSDLTPHVEAAPDRARLGDLEETSERRDITYLANKTGWDARAVAMPAAADQMGQRSGVASELFYALFRAGLPASVNVLARTSPQLAQLIWKQSIENGVIAKDLGDSLDQQTQQFTRSTPREALNPKIGPLSPAANQTRATRLRPKRRPMARR
jgi:hypothetical protein